MRQGQGRECAERVIIRVYELRHRCDPLNMCCENTVRSFSIGPKHLNAVQISMTKTMGVLNPMLFAFYRV